MLKIITEDIPLSTNGIDSDSLLTSNRNGLPLPYFDHLQYTQYHAMCIREKRRDLTKTSIPTEHLKKEQSDKKKHNQKLRLHGTMILDRLTRRVVSLSSDSNPTGVVKPVLQDPNLPTCNNVKYKRKDV